MSAHTYRLKPPTVKAHQLDARNDLRRLPPLWMVYALFHGVVIPGPDGMVTVKGLNGTAVGRSGDWVVNEGGRFSVMPDAQFKRMYERDE